MTRQFTPKKAQISIAAFVMLLICALLFRSAEISSGISHAIDLCLYTVFPSLFGMMILSNLILDSQIFHWLLRPFSGIARYIFRVSDHLTVVLLLSFIGGYPVGAKLLNELCKSGKLSTDEAERLLCFCVNAGPAFIVSAVSVPVFHNTMVGFLVLASHLLSNLVLGFISGIKKPIPPKHVAPNSSSEKPFSVRMVNSVNSAVRAMCVVCAFIITFSVLLTLIQLSGVKETMIHILSSFIPPQDASALVTGIFEVTQGCMFISGNTEFSVLLFTGITAWGGLCVHLQLSALLTESGIKMKRFFLWRIPHILLSVIFCKLLLACFSPVLATFAAGDSIQYEVGSKSPFVSLFLILLCVILLFTARKSGTINKKHI